MTRRQPPPQPPDERRTVRISKYLSKHLRHQPERIGLVLDAQGWTAHQLRSTPAARNHALTDAGATARVGGDVGEGLARIFSYTPVSDDAVERSAGTVLAGRAARQYT
ncbi:RNA 2'-phosphotransferase, partial [Streptomyces massasporeus]